MHYCPHLQGWRLNPQLSASSACQTQANIVQHATGMQECLHGSVKLDVNLMSKVQSGLAETVL